MGLEVLLAATRLDDREGVERFVREMPQGEGLRSLLEPGRTHRAEQYDAPSQTARYLLIDGVWCVCYVVVGVSLEQARAIARQVAPLQAWTTPAFHLAVERALGIAIQARE
jgi:hypothetical protein